MINFKIKKTHTQNKASPTKTVDRKKQVILLSSFCLIGFTLINLLLFNPEYLERPNKSDKKKEVKFGVTANILGPKISIGIKEDNFNRNLNPKTTPDINPNSFSSFYNNLPKTMPSFTTKPFTPDKEVPVENKFDPLKAYTYHASLTEKIKTQLSSLWELSYITDTPKDNSQSRFLTSYVLKTESGTSEKFDLITISKTQQLESLKTPRDALNALIEESNEINILKEEGNYLIYDLSTKTGYQIGKIMVDDKGIYVFGYVNLTTNTMPYTLKTQWIDRFLKCV